MERVTDSHVGRRPLHLDSGERVSHIAGNGSIASPKTAVSIHSPNCRTELTGSRLLSHALCEL